MSNADRRGAFEALMNLNGVTNTTLQAEPIFNYVYARRGPKNTELGDTVKTQRPIDWLTKFRKYPTDFEAYLPDSNKVATKSIQDLFEKSKAYAAGVAYQNAITQASGRGPKTLLAQKLDLSAVVEWLEAAEKGQELPYDTADYLRGLKHVVQRKKNTSDLVVRKPENLPRHSGNTEQILGEGDIRMSPKKGELQPDSEEFRKAQEFFDEHVKDVQQKGEERARREFGDKIEDLRDEYGLSPAGLVERLNQQLEKKVTLEVNEVVRWERAKMLPDATEFAALEIVLIEQNNELENSGEVKKEFKELYLAALQELGLDEGATKEAIQEAFSTASSEKSAVTKFCDKLADLKVQFSAASLCNALNQTTVRIRDEGVPNEFTPQFLREVMRGEREVTDGLVLVLKKVLREGGVEDAYAEYKDALKQGQDYANALPAHLQILAKGSGVSNTALEMANLRNEVLKCIPEFEKLTKEFKRDAFAETTITRATFGYQLETLLTSKPGAPLEMGDNERKAMITFLTEHADKKYKNSLPEKLGQLYDLIADRQKPMAIAK